MNECNDVITCLLIRIVMYGACICLDIAFPKWMTEIIQIAFGYNKWLLLNGWALWVALQTHRYQIYQRLIFLSYLGPVHCVPCCQ